MEMRKRSIMLISLVLLPALLSGCIIPPWWDDGYGYGGHHGGGRGGSHGGRR